MPHQELENAMGVVKAINVFGNGPNSSQIEAILVVNNTDTGFLVGAYPATEPAVFGSFVCLLTAAYYAKTKIEIVYFRVPGGLPRIVGITYPPAP